jgi:4-amino-4-deoxy-L-arabinose transferase-like glycosyltransferase
MKILEFFILIVIVFFGLILYTYKLDQIPSGFYIDEALPGYNAYSLLETGKDEYGKAFPVALRFYGSYNPPLYTFSVIPSIYYLGLNIFAVRLPAAIFGALSILVIYYLIKSIPIFKSSYIPLIAAFIFTISPWQVIYSRVGYEVGLAFLLFSLGILLSWLSLKKPLLLPLSIVFLSLSTYAAYAERFIVPLFILIFIVIFRETLISKKYRKYFIWSLTLGFLTQIPHFYLLTTPAFFPKSDLFSDNSSLLREFLSKYFVYFSPRSLFFLPDPDPQRSIPELSTFYPWLVLPYLLGAYNLFKEKRKNEAKFILLIAAIVPIPASLTKDPFSTHRALPVLLPLILIISLGIDRIIYLRKFYFWAIPFIFFCFLSLILLWRSYFVLLPQERATIWGYGMEQLSNEIKSRPDKHFVIDQTRIKPAYISLAFFLKIPPTQFQQSVDQSIKENYYTNLTFTNHYIFANIETKNVNWEEDIYKNQILIGDSLTISESQAKEHFLTKVFEIKDPLNEVVFIGYETNPKEKCKLSNSFYCN